MWSQVNVVSNECWSQTKKPRECMFSNECGLKWLWSQMNVVSNDCGLK